MLEYKDFYHIAEYGNKMWKGCLSVVEIAENAHDYKIEYDWSIEHNIVSLTMFSLCVNICEDMDHYDYDDWTLNIETMQNILEEFVLEVL